MISKILLNVNSDNVAFNLKMNGLSLIGHTEPFQIVTEFDVSHFVLSGENIIAVDIDLEQIDSFLESGFTVSVQLIKHSEVDSVDARTLINVTHDMLLALKNSGLKGWSPFAGKYTLDELSFELGLWKFQNLSKLNLSSLREQVINAHKNFLKIFNLGQLEVLMDMSELRLRDQAIACQLNYDEIYAHQRSEWSYMLKEEKELFEINYESCVLNFSHNHRLVTVTNPDGSDMFRYISLIDKSFVKVPVFFGMLPNSNQLIVVR